MAIWFDDFPLDYANDKGRDCLIEHLGIELLEAGDEYLKARMPVDRTRTPAGVLHGGASVTLAETLGTWAAAPNGFVYGLARPVHLGRTTHVWEVRVTDEGGKLALYRVWLTVAVLNTPRKYS